MRVLVCGGRDFVNVPYLWRVLDELHKENVISLIIEGASDDVTGPYKGADYWANEWAKSRGIGRQRVRAKWKEEGRAAGPIRNKRMLVDWTPELVIAFPGGAGTDNMRRQAEKAGVRVIGY